MNKIQIFFFSKSELKGSIEIENFKFNIYVYIFRFDFAQVPAKITDETMLRSSIVFRSSLE